MPLTISSPAAEARDLLTQAEAAARAAAVSGVSYSIRLGLTAGSASFTGRADVRFTLDQSPEAPIFLCFRGQTIQAMRLNGSDVATPAWNGYRLILDEGLLKRGAENRLEVEYENAFDTGGDGVFRFVDPEDSAEYIYTNFEPYEAHRMAPLFDQPDIKARLTLEVLAPSEWVVLANGAERAAGPVEADGRTLRTFTETPPLSTYLFAMTAGAFVGERRELRLPGRAEAIPVGLWSRRSLATHLEHDRFHEMTEQAFLYFGALFGREYPFDKLDHVFCPEFNVGAMENVGLITYTERYVFRSTPTTSDVTDLAEVVFHEIAHMWFGNLVTMRWWDDLWLNESFATYVSYLCLTEGAPYPDAWRDFNVQLKAWALREDDAPTTHPIAGSVLDTDQTFLNFDGITYGKGGAVLKQLGARLGREGFAAGLRLYFQRHAFANATLADFLAALEEGSGVPLADWSAQWLRTSGPNRFAAEVTEGPGGSIANLSVRQEIVSGDPVLRQHLMRIALIYPDRSGVRIEGHELLLDGERAHVPSATGRPLPLAVIPNHDDLAVGKIALDAATIRFATERLEEIPDGLLRQVTWTAMWELVRDGSLNASDYAALLVARLPEERDASIVQQIVESTLGPLLLRYLPDGERERWGSRIVEVARARLARGGDEGTRIVWSRILVLASVTPRDIEESWQVAAGETPLEGVEIDQDYRWALLIRGASHGLPQRAARLRAEAERDPSDRGERALLSAAAAEPSIPAKRAAWEKILTPNGHGSVKRTLAAAAGFAWPWQRELLAPYQPLLADALQTLGSSDVTFARDWFRAASFGLWGDPVGMLEVADKLIDRLGDPTSGVPAVDAARLRRFTLTERDALVRILRQRRGELAG
uniref:aminopeptidase N n=1 Tax=Candidatus Limnocylindrus sp. TaxID=2802978 RepID=UPI00404A705C